MGVCIFWYILGEFFIFGGLKGYFGVKVILRKNILFLYIDFGGFRMVDFYL